MKFLLFCLVFANNALAQDLSNDSGSDSLYFTYPVKVYYNAIGENAHIYNGYEYRTPDRNIKGSPYFLADGPITADHIAYDDGYYQDIPVQYDMVQDLLVIYRLGQNFKISLVSQKLNSFSIHKHDFIRVSRDSVNGVELITGFYDRIYTGRSTVLVKRRKYVKEVLEYNSSSRSYIEENLYYISFAGKYAEVSNKASVLKLFKTKKSEIKTYLRKNKLKFKSDFEKTLIATSAYYDQLTS